MHDYWKFQIDIPITNGFTHIFPWFTKYLRRNPVSLSKPIHFEILKIVIFVYYVGMLSSLNFHSTKESLKSKEL